MPDLKPFPRRTMNRLNALLLRLRSSPRWARLINRYVTVISFTGRRSGRLISTPVGYRRRGDVVTLGVQFADRKTWWRNFLGEGHPMTLQLDGTERTGHAVARRDEAGRVTITVHLDPVAG